MIVLIRQLVTFLIKKMATAMATMQKIYKEKFELIESITLKTCSYLRLLQNFQTSNTHSFI